MSTERCHQFPVGAPRDRRYDPGFIARRSLMPSLLRRHLCPACAHAHNFVLQSGPVTSGEEYAFACPETGRPTALRAAEPGIPVTFPPQGAVSLTRTRVRQAA